MSWTSEIYNGWANYETWAAYTWLTNDELSYNEVLGWIDDGQTEDELVRNLQDLLEAGKPEVEPSMYADLLDKAMSRINYTDIINSILES